MLLALSSMDPTTQGVLFLVAVVMFAVAAVVRFRGGLGWLMPLGLAFFAFVFAYNAFAAG